MKRFVFPLIIGIIDVVLLMIIVISAFRSPAAGKDSGSAAGRTSSVEESAEVRTRDTAETDKRKEPESTKAPATKGNTETSRRAFDPADYDTDDRPTLADFTWVTMEILEGDVPEDAPVYFSEILGGWKCYILDDPAQGSYAERLLNVTIEGTPEDITLTFDWFYTHLYNTDEGFDDSTPDSIYTGKINSEGYIETFGAGSAVLTDFYVQNGHQYAIGIMKWPDGARGYIAITRP